jgi:uncharacterized protein YukE
MSTRCRHDLIGCVTQLKSSLHRWSEAEATVAESWKDETATKFHDEYLSTVDETLSRMMAALQEAAELVRKIEKRVVDTKLEDY